MLSQTFPDKVMHLVLVGQQSVSLTEESLLRIHGPINCRCSSSYKQLREEIANPPVFLLVLPQIRAVKILQRIPKAATDQCAKKLVAILSAVVCKNNRASWELLLCFSAHCLRVPRREGKQRSLASVVISQLNEEMEVPT